MTISESDRARQEHLRQEALKIFFKFITEKQPTIENVRLACISYTSNFGFLGLPHDQGLSKLRSEMMLFSVVTGGKEGAFSATIFGLQNLMVLGLDSLGEEKKLRAVEFISEMIKMLSSLHRQ